jgi:hypothetical protein
MFVKAFINNLQVGQSRRHQNLVAYPLLSRAKQAGTISSGGLSQGLGRSLQPPTK